MSNFPKPRKWFPYLWPEFSRRERNALLSHLTVRRISGQVKHFRATAAAGLVFVSIWVLLLLQETFWRYRWRRVLVVLLCCRRCSSINVFARKFHGGAALFVWDYVLLIQVLACCSTHRWTLRYLQPLKQNRAGCITSKVSKPFVVGECLPGIGVPKKFPGKSTWRKSSSSEIIFAKTKFVGRLLSWKTNLKENLKINFSIKVRFLGNNQKNHLPM